MPKAENANKGKKSATNTKTKKVAATTKTKKVTKTEPKKTNATKKVVAKKTNVKKNDLIKEVKTEKVEKMEKEEKGYKKYIDELVIKVKSNTPFAISLCVIVVLLAILIFVASYKKVPKTSNGKEIVASLKGKTITADDLYEELKSQNGTDALIDIIDTYITEKEVKVTSEDKDYINDVVEYYKNYADYYQTDLITFLTDYVGLDGIDSEEEFYNFVLEDYKKTLAVVKFIGDNAKEEELKKYYQENYSDKITVRHILIEVNDDTTDADALNTAKNIINELNQVDASNLTQKFSELAQNYSDDPGTYSKGGLLENYSKNDLVTEFWNAAIELKNGEYTKEPVKTTYGYHIILKVSSTQAEKFDDVKSKVKKEYAQSLLSQDKTLLAKKWDELRSQYKLSIEDDFLKETYNKLIKAATKTEEN